VTKAKIARTKTTNPKGHTKEDMEDVLDNPEWTEEDFAKAKPFAEVFPDLARSFRRSRGPQKAPTKLLVSLRLDEQVIEHFKASGPGWQTRINETLRDAVSRGRKQA
jgi:uncharacterized protein (DUF4415 family)